MGGSIFLLYDNTPQAESFINSILGNYIFDTTQIRLCFSRGSFTPNKYINLTLWTVSGFANLVCYLKGQPSTININSEIGQYFFTARNPSFVKNFAITSASVTTLLRL